MTRSVFTLSPDELEAKLGDSNLRVADASFYLPAHGRDANAEFASSRIPGAVRFDVDVICDRESPFPHALPSPEAFAEAMGGLGLSESDEIVVHDGPGLFSAARAWWMLRVMGASNVRILDGGFDRWKQANRPVETGPPSSPKRAIFTPSFRPEAVRRTKDVLANLRGGEAAVLDARPFERFSGQAEEPRPGLRRGHIPGSFSVPFDRFSEDGKLLDIEALRELFDSVPLAADRPAITTCGSGVTAAIISLALESVGHGSHALYDGSWGEWGQTPDAPVASWEAE